MIDESKRKTERERERSRKGWNGEEAIPGADTGVITNKFSTRNEARKRERVNPKAGAEGARERESRGVAETG